MNPDRNPLPGPKNEPDHDAPRGVDSPLDPKPWPDDPSQKDNRSPAERANDDYPLDPEADGASN